MVVLVGAVCLGALFLFVRQSAAPLAGAASDYLTFIQKNQFDQAYAMIAPEALPSIPRDVFDANMVNLVAFQSVSWSQTSVDSTNGVTTGSIVASIVMKGGEHLGLKLSFAEEGGAWKVTKMEGVGEDASTGPHASDATLTVPSNAELSALTVKNIYNLAVAIKSGDFTAFYGSISSMWYDRSSPAKIKAGFQSYADSKDDLTGVKDMTPTFTAPATIDSQKILHVEGYFTNATGDQLKFATKYNFENGEWKLMSITTYQKTSKSFTI